MTTYQDILDKLRQSQLMQKFNANKQAMTNPQPSGFGHGIANLGMKMSQSQIPQIAKLGVGTQTFGNKLGALGAAKGLGNAGAMGGAAGALGKATPFVGGAMSGAQAAQDASKGDYIGAGLNGIAAGASFVPGIGTAVAMGAQALDSVNKMFRAAKDKANAKAMQKSMQEAQNSEQANAESTDQLQNQFANDSMQYADAMAQPSTYDDIMSRIQPVGNAGSPTGFATDINLPNEEETLQNEPATLTGHVDNQPTDPSQVQLDLTIPRDNDGNPIFTENTQPTKTSLMDRIKSGLADFKSGYDDNSTTSFIEGDLVNKLAKSQPQQPTINPLGNAVAEAKHAGYSQEQIDAMKQGLNGGNKDIAALIDKYNIRKPDKDNAEEIALAKAGDFNPDQITGAAAPAQTKKSIMQRLGEVAGTGQRVLSNPLTQGLIAGTVAGIQKGNMGSGLEYGVQWAQNKAKADNYYRQMNPGSKYTPVFGNYDANDYKVQQSIELEKQTLAEKIRNNIATADEVKRYHDLTTAETTRYHNIQAEETAKHHRNQEGIQSQGNAIRAGHYKVMEDQGAQRINNSKNNSDRDYQFKVQQAGLNDGSLIRMVAPDGSIAIIPISQKEKYVKKGAKPIYEYD
jgi:hypothetical protein